MVVSRSVGMRRTTKISLILYAVKPILMYGCETWALTEALTQRLDGCYTRILRMVQISPGSSTLPTTTYRGSCQNEALKSDRDVLD